MEQTLHNAFKRFSLGDELRAYTFLGCHAAERDGVHGYVFRVWAPRAQGVSVTGDWNFWNTEDLPMTLVEYGIWEAFSAYAREGDAYKFYIRRRDGSAVPCHSRLGDHHPFLGQKEPADILHFKAVIVTANQQRHKGRRSSPSK